MSKFLIYSDGDCMGEEDFKNIDKCLEYCEAEFIGTIQVYELVAEYKVPEQAPREWTHF
jgi:hypothetical protein